MDVVDLARGTSMGVRSVRARRVADFLAREWLLVLVSAVFVASSAIAARGWVTADAWLDFLSAKHVLHHGLPHANPLTLIGRDHQWIDQQWLGQLGLYGLFAAGGARLAALGTVAIFAAAAVFAFRLARRRGASARSVCLVAILGWLYLATWVQTEAFSHLFFVALVGLLAAESRRRTRRVLLAFPLLVVWANVHGAVVLGALLVALLGVVELARRRRATSADRPGLGRALALIVAPWLSVLATPYGFDVVGYYRSTIFNAGFRDYLGPWMPPVPFSLVGGPFFLLALLAAAVVARRWRRLTGFELAVLAVTFAGALEAERSIMWFVIACIVFVPALIERQSERTWREPSRRVRVGVSAGAAALAFAALAGAAAQPQSHYVKPFPAKAASTVRAYAAAHPHARVFATDEFADWLLYTQPSLRGRLAFDGRWEQLSADQIRAVVSYMRVSGANWERAARGYSVFVLNPKVQTELAKVYEQRPGIRELYRSPRLAVYARTRAA